MSTTTIRRSPSGPDVSQSDTLSPPGTILGRPLDAIGQGFAEPLDGEEVGQIIRSNGYQPVSLPAGATDNLPLPDGDRVLDITPTGAVILNGVARPAPRNNFGGNFILRKSGAVGTLSTQSNTSSVLANRFFTPAATLYLLASENDAVAVAYFNTRWQAARRLLSPRGISPGDFGQLVLPFAIRVAATNTGAPADDVVITAALPANTRITDVLIQIGTASAGATAQVRTAAGGGGVAVSSVLSLAAANTQRNNVTVTSTLAQGTPLFLRRSTGATAGNLVIFCQPTP